MHKGDLSREFYPNFTYQIVFTHFGMYILDCHVASLLAMTGRSELNLPVLCLVQKKLKIKTSNSES